MMNRMEVGQENMHKMAILSKAQTFYMRETCLDLDFTC